MPQVKEAFFSQTDQMCLNCNALLITPDLWTLLLLMFYKEACMGHLPLVWQLVPHQGTWRSIGAKFSPITACICQHLHVLLSHWFSQPLSWAQEPSEENKMNSLKLGNFQQTFCTAKCPLSTITYNITGMKFSSMLNVAYYGNNQKLSTNITKWNDFKGQFWETVNGFLIFYTVHTLCADHFSINISKACTTFLTKTQ